MITTQFIVGGFLFSILCSFFGMMAVSLLKNAKTITKIFVGIFVSVVLGYSATAIMSFDCYLSQKVWNGGYCPDCGTHWEFKSSVHYKNGGDDYYYSCPNCYTVIITDYLY